MQLTAEDDIPLVGQSFAYEVADSAHTYLYPWNGQYAPSKGGFGLSSADESKVPDATDDDAFNAFFDPVLGECMAPSGGCKLNKESSFRDRAALLAGTIPICPDCPSEREPPRAERASTVIRSEPKMHLASHREFLRVATFA